MTAPLAKAADTATRRLTASVRVAVGAGEVAHSNLPYCNDPNLQRMNRSGQVNAKTNNDDSDDDDDDDDDDFHMSAGKCTHRDKHGQSSEHAAVATDPTQPQQLIQPRTRGFHVE